LRNRGGGLRAVRGSCNPSPGAPELIRVFLVDDHASFRQALAFMVEREDDMTVVGEAGSLAEARAGMNGRADVAVVDLSLPDGNGVDLVAEFRAATPEGGVMILTASNDRRDVARAVEAGAAGVVHKSAGIDEIIESLRRVCDGQTLLPAQELVELLRMASVEREQREQVGRRVQRLTPREREVLQALADGLNNKEIARRLSITVETQRTHMVNILGKLGVHSQLQALVFAIRYDLVEVR
jgi:DNA-binding NarL/FixJ family response regulator